VNRAATNREQSSVDRLSDRQRKTIRAAKSSIGKLFARVEDSATTLPEKICSQNLVYMAYTSIFDHSTLKVMTLNLAHGRKDGLNQLLKSAGAIHSNFEEIAVFLENAGADVVALQEADAPSFWSGSFDHVELLAGLAGYPFFESSNQTNSCIFSSGTGARLSRYVSR
jgi:hypothetical protein